MQWFRQRVHGWLRDVLRRFEYCRRWENTSKRFHEIVGTTAYDRG
jgi:hypothetical protein